MVSACSAECPLSALEDEMLSHMPTCEAAQEHEVSPDRWRFHLIIIAGGLSESEDALFNCASHYRCKTCERMFNQQPLNHKPSSS